MEGLFRHAPEIGGLAVAPRLAATFEFKSERELHIELRGDVRWNDGRELLARDFVDSWKRVLSRCRSISQAERLFSIRGAEAYCRKKIPFAKVGIESPSPTRLVLHLSHPSPFFPRTLAHPVTWPRRLDTANPTALGLGPYVTGDGGRSFLRNPRYAFSSPRIDRIEFLAVPSAPERIGLYREKAVDIVDDLSADFVERLGPDPELVSVASDDRIYLLLDPNQKPLQSPVLRRAFARSFDKSETVQLVKRPLFSLDGLTRELPSTETRFEPSEKNRILPSDVSKIGLSWRENADLGWLAESLQAQWNKNLGVDIELLPNRLNEGTAPLRLQSWREDWFNPSLPPFVSLPAHAFPDIAGAVRSWTKIQRQWQEQETLVLPLFERGRALLKTPELLPLRASPVGDWDFSSLTWG